LVNKMGYYCNRILKVICLTMLCICFQLSEFELNSR